MWRLSTRITVAYHTFGILNADKSNVIWVMHGLTANSDVADWYPAQYTAKIPRPEKYFIICANVLGSCYYTYLPARLSAPPPANLGVTTFLKSPYATW